MSTFLQKKTAPPPPPGLAAMRRSLSPFSVHDLESRHSCPRDKAKGLCQHWRQAYGICISSNFFKAGRHRQESILSLSISFIYQQQETTLTALYSCYWANRCSQHAMGPSFSSSTVHSNKQCQSRYTVRPDSTGNKNILWHPGCKSNFKMSLKESQDQSSLGHLPTAQCGAGLGTRLLHKDLWEPLLSWLGSTCQDFT